MSLQNLLDLQSAKGRKQGLSEERLREQMEHLRTQIAFFREYPDLFVDFIKGPDCKFEFKTYQREIIRASMRHRYSYMTYPRGCGKSFLTMMCLMIKATLYPGAHLAVTTGGKEQAASITCAKIDEICRLIPALSNEIDWSRGATKHSKDAVEYRFKNGSIIDILAAKESSRGQRRHGIVGEEVILIDPDMLNEVVIPTTVVDRVLPDGHTRDHKEAINQSQTYITTAGYKNSFAYEKLVELMIQSLIEPNEVIVLGGSYLTPVAEGQLPEDFVQDQKLSGTYKEESFGREYGSVWAGDAENAFFSTEKFDKHRELVQAEREYSGRTSKSGYYILAIDVGRIGCTTECIVFKVTPQPNGASLKSIVNIYTWEAEHFGQQAINIKKMFYKYKARKAVIDTNGLGVGLLDFMVIPQVDPETGDELPGFGLENDDEKGTYKEFNRKAEEKDAIYQIKANAPMDTEAYVYVQSQISNGKCKFLIDEATAKAKLLDTKVGQQMDPDQRNEYLMPYVQTTLLRDQMANLAEETEGLNIKLKQVSRGIKKDKFSAFLYGMYYIKLQEGKKKKKFNASDFAFFN